MVALELASHPKLRALRKLAGGNQLVVLQGNETKFRRTLQALDYTAR